MPRPATQLRIPRPCQQSWAAMTSAGPGRHCAACQTVVVDFTQQTDGEILAYLARAGAVSCGRFRADQLGRPLMPAAASRWRGWLASALALGGVLGSGRVAAQAGGSFHPGPVPATVQPAAPTPPAAKPADPPAPAAPAEAGGLVLVRGTVVDAQCERLPGVMVLLAGTALGTSTDLEGKFNLSIPAAAVDSLLLFSFVGYSREQVPAARLLRGAAPVVLQEYTMGGFIGYSARPPAPWHPRALAGWARYWLARPFQR